MPIHSSMKKMPKIYCEKKWGGFSRCARARRSIQKNTREVGWHLSNLFKRPFPHCVKVVGVIRGKRCFIHVGSDRSGRHEVCLAVGTGDGKVIERIQIDTETPEITMPKVIAFFQNTQLKRWELVRLGRLILTKKARHMVI